MALLECYFKSQALGKNCEMNILMPQEPPGHAPYRVLYLLHGLSDNHSNWLRRTSVERYVEGRNLLVVMPDGARSFYSNGHNHYGNYWDFLSQELPAILAGMFPISTRREDTFAMGLSMGGFGAMKLALRQPERFAAACGLSSVADIKKITHSLGDSGELSSLLGTDKQIEQDGNDLFLLASRVARLPSPPRILMIEGTEDFMLEDNHRLRDHFQNVQYPGFQYAEAPGAHEWGFWDRHVRDGLQFLLGE